MSHKDELFKEDIIETEKAGRKYGRKSWQRLKVHIHFQPRLSEALGITDKSPRIFDEGSLKHQKKF